MPRKIKIAFILTIVIFLGIGLSTVWFKGFVDFPCFVSYDDINQCVMAGEQKETNIRVYITSTVVGWSGGGCYMKTSDTNGMEMVASNFRFEFKRAGEKLFVNGKELKPFEKFSKTAFWNLNPWTVYHIEFTNYGLTKDCSTSAPAGLVIIGESGNRVSVVKAIAILAVALGTIYFSLRNDWSWG